MTSSQSRKWRLTLCGLVTTSLILRKRQRRQAIRHATKKTSPWIFGLKTEFQAHKGERWPVAEEGARGVQTCAAASRCRVARDECTAHRECPRCSPACSCVRGRMQAIERVGYARDYTGNVTCKKKREK